MLSTLLLAGLHTLTCPPVRLCLHVKVGMHMSEYRMPCLHSHAQNVGTLALD